MSPLSPIGVVLVIDGIVSIKLKDKKESHPRLKEFGRLLRAAMGIVIFIL